jgi:hypothetical protein
VGVDGQHLPVEFLGRGGFLVEPVEVADVVAGVIDDARVVVVAVAFVPGYDGTWIEGLDDVEGRQPVLAALSV